MQAIEKLENLPRLFVGAAALAAMVALLAAGVFHAAPSAGAQEYPSEWADAPHLSDIDIYWSLPTPDEQVFLNGTQHIGRANIWLTNGVYKDCAADMFKGEDSFGGIIYDCAVPSEYRQVESDWRAQVKPNGEKAEHPVYGLAGQSADLKLVRGGKAEAGTVCWVGNIGGGYFAVDCYPEPDPEPDKE